MKRIILFITASLFSVTLLSAQTDSIKAQSRYYQNYPTKDMKKVATNEIPASLRATLQGSEYAGWEKGTIYYSSTTSEYSYQAPVKDRYSKENQKNVTPVWFRFDQFGTRIPDVGSDK